MLLFPCRAVKVNLLGLVIKCRKVDLSVWVWVWGFWFTP